MLAPAILLLITVVSSIAAPTRLVRRDFTCSATDDEGGTLTTNTLESDSEGALRACSYTSAGSCEYFAENGTFSSGASTCPSGLVEGDAGSASTSAEPTLSSTVEATASSSESTTQSPKTTTSSTIQSSTTTTVTSTPAKTSSPPPPPPAPSTAAPPPPPKATSSSPLPTSAPPTPHTQIPSPTAPATPTVASSHASSAAPSSSATSSATPTPSATPAPSDGPVLGAGSTTTSSSSTYMYVPTLGEAGAAASDAPPAEGTTTITVPPLPTSGALGRGAISSWAVLGFAVAVSALVL